MRLKRKPVSLQIRGRACYYYPVILLISGIILSNICYAQNIILKNPSLEGAPGRDSIPASWYAASNTPDILPGVFNIKLPASDGKTYAGLHSGPNYREGLGQQLQGELLGGMAYTLSMDLAFAPSYLYKACYGNLAIYGGNIPGDTAELLWKSGVFTDTTWKRHNAVLMPSKTYTYLSFWADPSEACDKSTFGSALLMDNFSVIKQVLKTQLSASPSCKHSSTGTVAANVTSGQAPFKYLWTPGNYTTAQVDHLPAGVYTVAITAANGTTGGGQVTVGASDLNTKITVTTSACAGENNNEIKLDVTGGVPPYHFYLDDIKAGSNSVFSKLDPGYHNVMVKDEDCADTFQVTVKEPEPLQLQQASTVSCSCSETNDGKIVLKAAGGTLPYQYRLYNEMWKQDSILSDLKAGYYQYEIKDANGCSLGGNANITSPWQNCLVVIPSAFSPNGDGNNDLFKPKIYDAVKNYQLSVFNRWGALVFRTSDPNAGWDGARLQSQSFIYVCTFNDRNNERKEYTGSLLLIK
ncbi:gliding motility-associated C-terminal domain-containing protein [Chitinophaga sp. CF118]|uniref:T9SS type B sorting domain-containing protein n=1 Tax=Chitinophaga sp. CF118 TaxID=1884367 RepID=UPI0015A56A1F|nr:gliding motility-associated C-terminal domain-containing protein [Chitinophaga sp. CF118]